MAQSRISRATGKRRKRDALAANPADAGVMDKRTLKKLDALRLTPVEDN